MSTPLTSRNSSQSLLSPTSIYQQSIDILNSLNQIPNIHNFLKDKDTSDPISLIWHTLRLGFPLIDLASLYQEFNFPDFSNITLDPSYSKTCKMAVYHFLVACKQIELKEDTLFQVSDLYREDTSALIKVFHTVQSLINLLVAKGKFPIPSGPLFIPVPASTNSVLTDTRSKIIHELLITERLYIQSLEELYSFQSQITSTNILLHHQIHSIFLNLDQLLDFQRRFLISMESQLALPAKEQRIGLLFSQTEPSFSVYQTFCGNYSNATSVVNESASILQKIPNILDPVKGLASLLIKPIQRVCRYPLLLSEIIRYTDSDFYPFLDELKEGLESAKRVTNLLNEQTRQQENEVLKAEIYDRVEDWKSLRFDEFGPLLLNDKFPMSTVENERHYQLILFQRILLCCKETSKKKKRKGKDDLMVYVIKGNIYVTSITGVSDISKPSQQSFGLKIFWINGSDIESFSLKCRNIEQVQLWKNRIEKLIQMRRQSVSELSLIRDPESSSILKDIQDHLSFSEDNDEDGSRPVSSNSTPPLYGKFRDSQSPEIGQRKSTPSSISFGSEGPRSAGLVQNQPGFVPPRNDSSLNYQTARPNSMLNKKSSKDFSEMKASDSRSSRELLDIKSPDLRAYHNLKTMSEFSHPSEQSSSSFTSESKPGLYIPDIKPVPALPPMSRLPIKPTDSPPLIPKSFKPIDQTTPNLNEVRPNRNQSLNHVKSNTAPPPTALEQDKGITIKPRMASNPTKPLPPVIPLPGTPQVINANQTINVNPVGTNVSDNVIQSSRISQILTFPDPPVLRERFSMLSMGDKPVTEVQTTEPPINYNESKPKPNSNGPKFKRIKAIYGTEIFMVAIPTHEPSYQLVYTKIESKMKLLLANNIDTSLAFRMQYKDTSGDMVYLAGDEDIEWVFNNSFLFVDGTLTVYIK